MRSIVLMVLLAAPLQAQERPSITPTAGTIHRDGIGLHYLEWRGAEPAVVLLPGYALTAHAYRDVGAGLAGRHRVVAVTFRGFGESDAPDDGAYTIGTLVADLAALLDALHLERPVLVGHSLAGTVIAAFALRYPTRVRQLIFLDAFPYRKAEGGDSVHALDTVAPPPFAGDTTYDAVAAYLGKYRFVPWRAALDADLRHKPIGAESARRRRLTEGYIRDQWAAPPRLAGLAVPAVQVCAIPTVRTEYPWLRPSMPDYPAARRFIDRSARPFQHHLCDRFLQMVPGGRTVDVPGSHYIFFTEPAVTVRLIRDQLRAVRDR